MSTVDLVTLGEADLGKVQMFCGHSPTYRRGYDAKMAWVEARLREGMHYTLLRNGRCNAGLIEYLPGEHAWRGVEANGYLFIHCLWVIGKNRGQGYGRLLLDACLEDARGTRGVAVMVSKTHWLPTPKLFLKNGFELADRADPSYDLLVKRLNPEAPLPRFRRKIQVVPPGLTLYHSDQCPYTQNVAGIVEAVGSQLGIPVNIIRITDARQAQECTCRYGTLGYFLDSKLLTYHPTGTEKLIALIQAGRAGKMEAA